MATTVIIVGDSGVTVEEQGSTHTSHEAKSSPVTPKSAESRAIRHYMAGCSVNISVPTPDGAGKRL